MELSEFLVPNQKQSPIQHLGTHTAFSNNQQSYKYCASHLHKSVGYATKHARQQSVTQPNAAQFLACNSSYSRRARRNMSSAACEA